MQNPQFIHFEASTKGRPMPSWLIAPTGHLSSIGHLWSCGHLSGFTKTISYIIPVDFFENARRVMPPEMIATIKGIIIIHIKESNVM